MTTKLTVEGMSCGGCEATVVEALEDLSGVETATADHATDTVSVEGDADTEDLVAAVERAGYDATA